MGSSENSEMPIIEGIGTPSNLELSNNVMIIPLYHNRM